MLPNKSPEPLALAVPLSRFTSRVGGGSAFFVRPLMPPLKNMSRKAVVAISLLAWFVPSLFLLFQLAKNGTTGIQRMFYLPMMYGFTLAMWFRALLQQHWFYWAFTVIVSLGLPVMLVVLMLRTSRWRPVVLIGGLILSCALTAAAYCLLIA